MKEAAATNHRIDRILAKTNPEYKRQPTEPAARPEPPADAYITRFDKADSPVYTGNSPQVVVELLRMLDKPTPQCDKNDLVEIGFPGQRGNVTYVGSWQWGIHGEVSTEEGAKRAAAATLAAIQRKESGER